MNPTCQYPQYGITIPDDLMERCADMAPGLLHEAGMWVGNERFLARLRDQSGIRIDGPRVFFDPDLVRRYVRRFIEQGEASIRKARENTAPATEWVVGTAGFSMLTIDIETEELREATRQDLRDLIKLTRSFGVGGSYMVMPQDSPPLMRAIDCFKICFECSDTVRAYDWQQPEQAPFIYEMCQTVGRTMDVVINIPTTFCLDPKELDLFLAYYPFWKKNRDIHFRVVDYPMMGITKPVSVPGCALVCFAETLACHILFNLFDPELNTPIVFHGGVPTDLRHACWAFGSPRAHALRFLNSMLLSNLCRMMPNSYTVDSVYLETTSSGIDEQAALEKMGVALTGALQGARRFDYTGVLCVDDIYSGTQFVIDMEIIEYIKETIGAFTPHADILNIDGLYEECLEVARGGDTFLSHPNTAARFRNIVPSPPLIVREKARSWLSHRKLLKDRAREIALDRIRNATPFVLAGDKQKELDRIYERAKKELH